MGKQWSEVIGIGSTVYDTLMVVNNFPVEDTKLEGVETRVQGGGPCATALVAARKLGISTAYMVRSVMIRLDALCLMILRIGVSIRIM